MRRNPRQDLLVIGSTLEQLREPGAKEAMALLSLHLRRVIHCADIDTLTPPTLMLEDIRCRIEARHAKHVLVGIRRVRGAIEGLEALLDRLPLARPGAVPTPCLELDIPKGGLVDRVLHGRRPKAKHGMHKRPTMPVRKSGRAGAVPRKSPRKAA